MTRKRRNVIGIDMIRNNRITIRYKKRSTRFTNFEKI